jgi:hypothetical protein
MLLTVVLVGAPFVLTPYSVLQAGIAILGAANDLHELVLKQI